MAESSSNSSSSSAGKMTFGRTPPPSLEDDDEDYTISHNEEYADLAGNRSEEHQTDDSFQTVAQIESSQEVGNWDPPSDGETFPSDQRNLLNNNNNNNNNNNDDVDDDVGVHVHVRAEGDST